MIDSMVAASLLSAIGCLLVLAGSTPPAPRASTAGPPDVGGSDTTLARRAAWAPRPGPWEPQESVVVQDHRGIIWKIEIASRTLGFLEGGRGEVALRIPRARILRKSGEETIQVAVLLPIDNRSVALFAPGSPEETAVPTDLIEDGYGRWPNLCQFAFRDTSGELDVNGNSITEIALRRFCSCPERACGGLVLVELSVAGPRLVDPGPSVFGVNLGDVTLEDLLPSDDVGRPVLKLALDYLEDCRYLGMVGVRGRNECRDCCLFPVYVRLNDVGVYWPIYDPQSQATALERAQRELGYVAAGDPSQPLQTLEEAQIAHAAAFFYLTGSGEETPGIVLDVLESRRDDYRLLDLLGRLDRFFRPKAHKN